MTEPLVSDALEQYAQRLLAGILAAEQATGTSQSPLFRLKAGIAAGMIAGLADVTWCFQALVADNPKGKPQRAIVQDVRHLAESALAYMQEHPFQAPEADAIVGRLDHTTVAMTEEQHAAAQEQNTLAMLDDGPEFV